VCNELEDDGVADLVLQVVTGPEAVTGSTRMKAALAQKMLLTMITTASMVRWGKTYENLMVDVAPTSQKLVERAKGLVMELGGTSYEEAARLLDETDFRVKHAVIMAREGVDVQEAGRRLDAAEGRLRIALGGDVD
jgi:N-acetylmuramic acid 6-phosphate etherase